VNRRCGDAATRMMRQATMFDCVFLYVLSVRAGSRIRGLDLLRADAI
jgi:hypothetical protein